MTTRRCSSSAASRPERRRRRRLRPGRRRPGPIRSARTSGDRAAMLGMRAGRPTGRARKSILMTTSATPGQQADSGGAAGRPGRQAPGPGLPPGRIILFGAIAVVATIAVIAAVFVIVRKPYAAAPRPSGIPASVSTSLANEMLLTPLPHDQAPGFTLTDQAGRTMKLSALRGKVVVLQFMDPHCTDICPIVSQEFVDAYHKLG